GEAFAVHLLAADGRTPLLSTDRSGAITAVDLDPDGSTHSRSGLSGTSDVASTSALNRAVVVNAPLSAALIPLAVQEGTPFSGAVGTFTNGNHFEVASQLSATIDWGDGSPIDVGTIAVDGGHFTVSG